jgi:hypothetical protein
MVNTHITNTAVQTIFKESIDWNKFYSVVQTIGNNLNGHKERFDKSDILELSMEVLSSRRILYINEEGRDLFIPELNVFCEMKYQKDLFYTSKRLDLRDKHSLTLINTQGERDSAELPNDYAEFIIALGNLAVGIVKTSEVKHFFKKTKTQIIAEKIPTSFFSMVCIPQDIDNIQIKKFAYLNDKKKLQEEFLNQFL